MAKTAIVLGGSAGVGRAVTDRLIARGYRVGVIARDATRLEDMEAELGGAVATASADVSDEPALRDAVARLVDTLGAPKIWVNNAMLTSFSPFHAVEPKEFERIVDVTFLGQVNGTRLAMQHMLKGRIVCVGSGLSYRPVPFQAAYCGAKHAINGFVGAVRSELIREGSDLTIHLVQLPAINTPQFDWALNRLPNKPQPAPPIFQPDVAAQAVMKAIDDGSREIFVGTSVLQLFFGDAVLPGWLDRKLATAGAEQQQSDREDTHARPNLYTPIAYPSRAEGSYSGRAYESGIIVDADLARKLVFGGGLALAFLLGLAIG